MGDESDAFVIDRDHYLCTGLYSSLFLYQNQVLETGKRRASLDPTYTEALKATEIPGVCPMVTFLALPNDVLIHIASDLDIVDIWSLRKVSFGLVHLPKVPECLAHDW